MYAPKSNIFFLLPHQFTLIISWESDDFIGFSGNLCAGVLMIIIKDLPHLYSKSNVFKVKPESYLWNILIYKHKLDCLSTLFHCQLQDHLSNQMNLWSGFSYCPDV